MAGGLLISSGDNIEGMDYLLRALSVDKDNPDVHSALAAGYAAVGDDDNAALHRRQAAKLRHNRPSDKLRNSDD